MEKDTTRQDSRAVPPVAAVFVAPEVGADEVEAVPHQVTATAKPPVGAPFSGSKDPRAAGTPTKRIASTRPVPEQLTFGDPEPPVTSPVPTSAPVAKPFVTARPTSGNTPVMKKVSRPTTPEHSSAPAATSTPSASTPPRVDMTPGTRAARSDRPEAAKPAIATRSTGRPEAITPEATKLGAAKSAAAKSAPAKPATRSVAKATPRIGVTQAHFTPPAEVSEPAVPSTIIRPAAKAAPAAKIASEPAEAATAPAKKTTKKAAPKRAVKAVAKPTPAVEAPALTEPGTAIADAAAPIVADETSAQVETPVRAEPIVAIIADEPAALAAHEPATPFVTNEPVVVASTIAETAEITAPKQTGPADPIKPPPSKIAAESIPKVFVGDVLAAKPGATAGRTREDLPSETSLARVVKAQPLLTSAALALASVARFGESAREQAEWLRSVYPKVGPERLARVALDSARKRTRYAVGATLLGGPLGVAASVSTLAVAKARLIIDIAAIFGADPLDPDRAVDVLVLLGAYADAPAATKAVAELIGDGITDTAEAGDVTAPRPTLVAAATAQLLTKAVGRLIPGMGALAQALRSTSETEQLTDRTIRYFKR
jgi:hypothetical protein